MTTPSTSSDRLAELGERVRVFQAMQLPGQPVGMHMGTLQLVNDLFSELKEFKAQEDAVVSVVDNMNVDNWHSIGHWVRQFDEALSRVRVEHEDLRTEEQKRDEEMVNDFAHAMKLKLSAKRAEGRGGWWDSTQCSAEQLARMLVDHVAKGNEGSFVDVANFAAMLYARNEEEHILADVYVDEVDRVFGLKFYRGGYKDALDRIRVMHGIPEKDLNQALDVVLNRLNEAEAEMRRLKGHYDNALGMIRMRGVPEQRAATLTQALDVLLTRLDRDIRFVHGLEDTINQLRDEKGSLIEENERLIAELSETKKQVTDAEEGPPPWPSPVEEILHELDKAREKFPLWPDDIIHASAIVQEESGELGQAALQATYEPDESTFDDAYGEAIQTAAMAIRFMQNMPHYVPSHRKQHTDDGSIKMEVERPPSVTTESIPDYGDLMKVEDFDFNFFGVDDGSGYWATEYWMSRLNVHGTPQPPWATHVVWFNK